MVRRDAASRLALPLVLVAASCLAASCGSDDRASAPRGPDLSTPEAALHAALRASATGDLAAFQAFLTPAGAERVRRDLGAWRDVLLDPAQGPRLLARLGRPANPADATVRERALAGDPASLFRLYVLADPVRVPDAPPAAPSPPRPAEAVWAELRYEAADGSLRRVVLIRDPDRRWRIDQFQL